MTIADSWYDWEKYHRLLSDAILYGPHFQKLERGWPTCHLCGWALVEQGAGMSCLNYHDNFMVQFSMPVLGESVFYAPADTLAEALWFAEMLNKGNMRLAKVVDRHGNVRAQVEGRA